MLVLVLGYACLFVCLAKDMIIFVNKHLLKRKRNKHVEIFSIHLPKLGNKFC